jgi:hypothetical protein
LMRGIDTEQILEFSIRGIADPRGVARADDDRNPVGDFVIQNGEDTFTGSKRHIISRWG